MAENNTGVQNTDNTKNVNVYENYNYVSTKESVAYLLNDVSNTFNIN